MNQFDNYELTTIDYALRFYIEENKDIDEEDIEWCDTIRKKIDTIIGVSS